MKNKTLIVMASCGAVLTVLGLALDSGRDSRAAWSQTSELIFPDLPDQAQEADTLVIESASGVTTLTRSGEDWTVAERQGYPGRGDEVGRLLLALAQARRVEPLTSKPELHEQLGLGGFAREDSPTVRLTARVGKDTVLADLYIGNRRTQGVGEGWYVRQPDEDETWAAQSKLRCPRNTSEWLQTELLDIARDRIERVRLEGPTGEIVLLKRQAENGPGFDIENLPQGREPKTASSAPSFLGSLASLRISDVQSNSEGSFPTTGLTRTTWTTSAGLWIKTELAEEDENLLARFEFGYSGQAATTPQLGPVPAPDEDAENRPTPEELQAEAAQLNAATEGWIFVLPSWKTTSFITTMEDLLVPLVEEEDGEAGESDSVVPDLPLEVPEVEAQDAEQDSEGTAETEGDGDGF